MLDENNDIIIIGKEQQMKNVFHFEIERNF